MNEVEKAKVILLRALTVLAVIAMLLMIVNIVSISMKIYVAHKIQTMHLIP